MRGKFYILGSALALCYSFVTLIGSLTGDSQSVFEKSGAEDGDTLCTAIAFDGCVISSLRFIAVYKNNGRVKPLAHVLERTEDAAGGLTAVSLVVTRV